MNADFIAYSQFGAGIVLLSYAVLQLTYRKKSFININLSGLFFCIAATMFYRWLFTTGAILNSRYILNFDIALTFAIGPFILFYIRSVTGLRDPACRLWALNFVPALIVSVVLAYLNISDSSFIRFYQSANISVPVYTISPTLAALDLISNIHIFAYVAAAIWTLYPLIKTKNCKAIREVLILIIYICLVSVAAACMIAASIMENAAMTSVSVYVLVAMGVWFFLFSFRHPEFTQKAVKESKMMRYENAPVDGEDSSAVLARLDLMMNADRLFADDELSLEKTSALLGVTTHQLSRYINDKTGMNFRGYLNMFRIEEAKKLLIGEPDKTILEIAFMTGFNSKSSFNAVFMKSEGLTPREFRSVADEKESRPA